MSTALPTASRYFHAPWAYVGLPGECRWQANVLLGVDEQGHWCSIQADSLRASNQPIVSLDAPIIPGLVNAHSHAFQRAIAGLTERSGASKDDFWRWRDRMYAAALRITPDQLEAIATLLYAELAAGGYTQVCEFHYLHNDLDGRAYASGAELALALTRAAQTVGIGLTLLPALYERSGFAQTGLRADQRRFSSTAQSILTTVSQIDQLSNPLVNTGLALHSLRAVTPTALDQLVKDELIRSRPIHIHIAEQRQEVDDCLATYGARPIDWLLDHADLNSHWNLVHATHASEPELARLANTGAAIVLCPSTEANLGDGIFDLPHWTALGGQWSIGSDSHVCRQSAEEWRLLEYSQRLSRRERNVFARAYVRRQTAAKRPAGLVQYSSQAVDINEASSVSDVSSAELMLQASLSGGCRASGLALAGIALGQRADFCLLDVDASALLGLTHEHWLDAWVFSSPSRPVKASYVAGRAVHLDRPENGQKFVQAMRALSVDQHPPLG